MAPQAKRVKRGSPSKAENPESIPFTPVSKSGPSRSRQVRPKKFDDYHLDINLDDAPSEATPRRSLNTTLDPELFEPKSRSKSSAKRKKPVEVTRHMDSPSISELLDLSGKQAKTPKTVDEVFAKYMEQDPYASIWKFIPQDRPPSPDRPLTFFSPPKERPRKFPRNYVSRFQANSGTDDGRSATNNVSSGQSSGSSASKDLPFRQTPLFGKPLDASAYSPRNSAGKRNASAWSYMNDTNGSNYSPAPSCSTPSMDPFKTPSSNSFRQSSSSCVPLSGVKALFREKSQLADSPADSPLRGLSPTCHPPVPEHVKKTILLGVTCYVDVKYNKENRSKYVQDECISLGAKVEKNFTKKVTHVVFKGGRMSTYIKAKENNIPIVSLLWLESCKAVGNMVDPALYPPTENEKYAKEMPLEEDRRRERFLQRSRAFLARLNAGLPIKTNRNRSGKKGGALESVTEGKKKAKATCPPKKQVEPVTNHKVPKKLNFNQAGRSNEKKPDSGDSDYVSESEAEDNGQPKRRRSAPPDIGGPSGSAGQKKVTEYFSKQPEEKPEGQPKCRSPDRTPKKEDKELLKVLTGGFTTQDKKKRKLFDPNQSLMSQPLPVDTTPIELSPYVKDTPESKRSASRTRTTSSKKPSSRSKSSSSKTDRRVRDAKRHVTARKSLVPLMEQHEEEEESMAVSTSRNSLACFDLTKKGKVVAPKCQPHIAFTSIPKDDVARYKDIISRLGTFIVDPSVTKHTTHLLTSTPVKRTINLLKAIARGCWILDVEWLINSEQSGKWMSEEPFELKSFSEAVTASRLEKQAFGKDYSMDLFSDCGPIFVDSDVQPPRLDLVSLLKICCAKVVGVSTQAVIIVSRRPLTDHNSQVDVVSPLWVLDSITHNRRMDLADYRI